VSDVLVQDRTHGPWDERDDGLTEECVCRSQFAFEESEQATILKDSQRREQASPVQLCHLTHTSQRREAPEKQ
jgi:hypothetical protein